MQQQGWTRGHRRLRRRLLAAIVLGALTCAAIAAAPSASAATFLCKKGTGCVKTGDQCMIDLGNGYVEIFDSGDSFVIQGADGKPSTWTCKDGNWIVSLTEGDSSGIRGPVIGRGVFEQGPPTPPTCIPDSVTVCQPPPPPPTLETPA